MRSLVFLIFMVLSGTAIAECSRSITAYVDGEWGKFELTAWPTERIPSNTRPWVVVRSTVHSAGEWIDFWWSRSNSVALLEYKLYESEFATCYSGSSFCQPGDVVRKNTYDAYPARGHWQIAVHEYKDRSFTGNRVCSLFTVQNAPTASIYSVTGVFEKGEQLRFEARGSLDTEYAALSSPRYYWDFGDGHTAVGRVVYHTYASEGTKTVRLRSFDGHLYSPWQSKSVTIYFPPEPPPPEWCGPGTPYQCK